MNILFVCTGNTCRSPMAAAVARDVLADRPDVDIASAGTDAYDGDVAYQLAIDTAEERRGFDLSGHRARRLTPGDVAGADLVLVMTRQQEAAVRSLDPAANVRCLNIGDPMEVGTREAYDECWTQLEEALRDLPEALAG